MRDWSWGPRSCQSPGASLPQSPQDSQDMPRSGTQWSLSGVSVPFKSYLELQSVEPCFFPHRRVCVCMHTYVCVHIGVGVCMLRVYMHISTHTSTLDFEVRIWLLMSIWRSRSDSCCQQIAFPLWPGKENPPSSPPGPFHRGYGKLSPYCHSFLPLIVIPSHPICMCY